MGRHKSWWNNKNLGLWLSRYQYHCTIWLIYTIWQFIKNLAKVTKRPLIEVCVEMIMVANLFFLVNKRLQNRQSYVLQYIFKNSLSYIFTFVFWFFGGIYFLFCFVFCSCLANFEKKQFYENVSCDSHVHVFKMTFDNHPYDIKYRNCRQWINKHRHSERMILFEQNIVHNYLDNEVIFTTKNRYSSF